MTRGTKRFKQPREESIDDSVVVLLVLVAGMLHNYVVYSYSPGKRERRPSALSTVGGYASFFYCGETLGRVVITVGICGVSSTS